MNKYSIPIPVPERASFPRWEKECFEGVMPGRAIASNEFDALGAECLLRGNYDADTDDSGNVDPAVDLRVDGRIVRLSSLDTSVTSQNVEQTE